jgi:mono/diheme cytochrome c family protein
MNHSAVRRKPILLCISLPLWLSPLPSPAATNTGLAVTFTQSQSQIFSHSMVLPNFALYVAAQNSPTPFIPLGPFTATWNGFVSVDLRSDYFFAADLNGKLRLEINDTLVFEEAKTNSRTPLSKSIRLNKGANALKATFSSPPTGDAFLRVSWTEKGTNTAPIPASALTHNDSPALNRSAELARGRELFIEHRCAKCHETDSSELLDAPSFENIGDHRKTDWLARWILDPKALRPNARMPKMLRDTADAAAIAAFLATLKSSQSDPAIANHKSQIANSSPLFERLHCNACHELSAEAAAPKISLHAVGQKFTTNALVAFLLNPSARFESIRMPDLKLTPAEATELAAHLLGQHSTTPTLHHSNTDIEKGKHLVQTTGCLNCHTLKLENKFSAPKAAALVSPRKSGSAGIPAGASFNWTRGCLEHSNPPSLHHSTTPIPNFAFAPEERSALQAFGQISNLKSQISNSFPLEFALRQTRVLNCNGCHGQLEGFPALDALGDRLNAPWMARFISGDLPYKPRPETHPTGEPWLEARMPAFKAYGARLAEGLAALHGYPPHAPSEQPPIDPQMAELGRKLVGKDGGFSCISCHGVRSLKAMEVFDAQGINFQWSADRLLPDYYRRWMRNPLAIDPQTKMPAYFEDGLSPLTEVLDGDAEKQIDAIWHYLRLRDKMPLPATEPSQ